MAIAVDTNIIVRLMIADDEKQLKSVRELLKTQSFFVPLTVLLEAYWVLKSRYQMTAQGTATALLGLSRLSGIELQHGPWAEWAIARFADGADFADMLHLAACDDVTELATFDRNLARDAGADSPVSVSTLR